MNLEDDCSICLEQQICKMVFNPCAHYICTFCYDTMSKKKCPLCNLASGAAKIYHATFDLIIIFPHVTSLYDKIMKSNIVQETEITSLLIEYVKWLKLVAENDSLIPSVLIDSVWTIHILDTKNYVKTCNNLGHSFIHRIVNTDVMKITYGIIDTKKYYEKMYGHDMLETMFWKFDETYDIGMIIGTIYVKNFSDMLIMPFSLTMTCKQLKNNVERCDNNYYSDTLRFVFNGKILFDDTILSQKVKIDDVIHMTFAFRGD